MKILITGSRGWHDRATIRADLLEYRDFADSVGENLTVIHGDCPQGADRIARQLCKELGIEQIREPADWKKHGKAAGPIRNQLMLDEYHPDLAIAYRAHGKSNGTDDMIRRCNAAHVRVITRDASGVHRVA